MIGAVVVLAVCFYLLVLWAFAATSIRRERIARARRDANRRTLEYVLRAPISEREVVS